MYRRHWTTPEYLKLVRSHTEPYVVDVLGLQLTVFPNVMSPKYDWSGQYGVEVLPDVRGKSFLDVGCGCGIVAVHAALRGARLTVALDISPVAASNTQFNLKSLKAPNAHVVRSDGLDAIGGRFDVIFFNAPFHGDAPSDWLERGVSDMNYKTLLRFVENVSRNLTKDGIVVLGFSDSGDESLLARALKAAQLSILSTRVDQRDGYLCKYHFIKPTEGE